MAILASDILPTISAALPERAAEIPPFSPKTPVLYGEIAKKRFTSLFFFWVSLVQIVLHFEQRQIAICAAADTREPSAANAPIPRHQPSLSRHKNVNSVAFPVLRASHFSGCIATEGSPLGHKLQKMRLEIGIDM